MFTHKWQLFLGEVVFYLQLISVLTTHLLCGFEKAVWYGSARRFPHYLYAHF